MTDEEHHRRLERLYEGAPVSRLHSMRLTVSDGRAEVRMTARPEFLHAAGGVHGMFYFRALDDAAFFAANSRVRDAVLLTVSFTVHFARPLADGEMTAVGRLLHEGGRIFHAAADLVDGGGRPLGHGSGVFARSAIPLDERVGYR